MRKFAKNLLKVLLYLYCIGTAVPSVLIFKQCLLYEKSLLFSIAASIMSFIIVDIPCCFIENRFVAIQKKRQKKLKDTQKEEEKLEVLLQTQGQDCSKQLETAKETAEQFLLQIENWNVLSSKKEEALEEILRLKTIYEEIEKILKVLEVSPEKYSRVRHIFSIYLPAFQKICDDFFALSSTGGLNTSNKTKLLQSTEDFYDYLKRQNIYQVDNENLQHKLSSFTDLIQMETERKKGGNND